MTSLPKINSYQFGEMIINDKPVTSDLIILCSGSLIDNWRRRQGHFLELNDIPMIQEACPDLFVIGTGISGQMRIDANLIEHFSQENVTLHIHPTVKAVKIFNQLRLLNKHLAACFHLTC